MLTQHIRMCAGQTGYFFLCFACMRNKTTILFRQGNFYFTQVNQRDESNKLQQKKQLTFVLLIFFTRHSILFQSRIFCLNCKLKMLDRLTPKPIWLFLFRAVSPADGYHSRNHAGQKVTKLILNVQIQCHICMFCFRKRAKADVIDLLSFPILCGITWSAKCKFLQKLFN